MVVVAFIFVWRKYENTRKNLIVVWGKNFVNLMKICWVAKIIFRSYSPNPLSKNGNCTAEFVNWNRFGNAGIFSLRRGVSGTSLSFLCEWIVCFRLLMCNRLTTAVSEKFGSAAPKIYCVACCFHLNSVLGRWMAILTGFSNKVTIYA